MIPHMKSSLAVFLFVCFLILGFAAPQTKAEVSIDFFYDSLEPYGEWQEVGDYGYCWRPYDVAADWSPYSDGRWAYTDAGWTWDSDEPYSWAVYHYGRWADISEFGWVWVPGTEWGPAWVSWRRSRDYVGWAPLPPEATFSVSIGFRSWVDDHYDIGPGCYRFVDGRDLGSRRLDTVFIDRSRNVEIINETTNITNITYKNNTVYNEGPRYDQQVRQSREAIPRYKLDRRTDLAQERAQDGNRQYRSRVEGDSLSVLAPAVDKTPTGGRPKRVSKKVDKAVVNHGWRELKSEDEVEAVRSKMKSKARAPQDLASRPRKTKDENSTARENARPDVGLKPGNGEQPVPVAENQRPRDKAEKEAKRNEPVTRSPQPSLSQEGATTQSNEPPSAKGPTSKSSKPRNNAESAPGSSRPQSPQSQRVTSELPSSRSSPEKKRTSEKVQKKRDTTSIPEPKAEPRKSEQPRQEPRVAAKPATQRKVDSQKVPKERQENRKPAQPPAEKSVQPRKAPKARPDTSKPKQIEKKNAEPKNPTTPAKPKKGKKPPLTKEEEEKAKVLKNSQ